ncbi:hypothetical protein [Vibrio agarivorans]|uniref:Uncharacterized protein n=1 Tax=Vibrio agarivorans TaxID=153622 RepID=A0ABT7Y768_9VIBR|nr:hypothetical protein [Vibrio agarivorans]MDN2483897.1 hypothetical protein [Vibrio agarivorans]
MQQLNERYSDTEIHKKFPVGTLVTVGKPCLGNDEGNVAVVYENYTISEQYRGISLLFANGSYDGFSSTCMQIFNVERVGFCEQVSDYLFLNVGKLSEDFRLGRFKSAFASDLTLA